MQKIDKVLVVGLGSIGKRHLDNLIFIGGTNISVVTSKNVSKEYPNVTSFKNLDEALLFHSYGWAWICTPTAHHEVPLVKLLDAKVSNIFLEKPITNDVDSLERLNEKISTAESSNVVVGYDLRFDPGILKVKEFIEEGKIGKLLNANAFVGQYLPDWRPYEDYRKGMSAKIETGGGVMLDLVHEFDYLSYFCGKATFVACKNRNSGALEIETEDIADVLLQYQSGTTATIHLDYLQRKLVRYCIFTGDKGTITLDLAERNVKLNSSEDSVTFDYSFHERNERFIDVMNAFIEGDERLCSFEDGTESLKQIFAAKNSSQTNTFIAL